jgi:hypothetical protein
MARQGLRVNEAVKEAALGKDRFLHGLLYPVHQTCFSLEVDPGTRFLKS